MLYVRNVGDAKSALSDIDHLIFIKECEVYIEELKAKGILIAAQPIVRSGYIIAQNGNEWDVNSIDITKEVQVGYYHIMAPDIAAAVEIAKANPKFKFVPSASVEVRPIKTKETQTGFVYPT